LLERVRFGSKWVTVWVKMGHGLGQCNTVTHPPSHSPLNRNDEKAVKTKEKERF